MGCRFPILYLGAQPRSTEACHIVKLIKDNSSTWWSDLVALHLIQDSAEVVSLSEAFRRHVLAFQLLMSLPCQRSSHKDHTIARLSSLP